MLPQELIRKKRDGHALTDDEIAQVVRGITENTFTESQVSAFAMAVWSNPSRLACPTKSNSFATISAMVL